MKQEEKSALSREKILDAAMEEFARRGYAGASLNTVWEEKHISKGMIYHHFKDKDELYLFCVRRCFDALTDYLRETAAQRTGTAGERVERYFSSRLRFFSENPQLLGLFADASMNPPEHLRGEIAALRGGFDALNTDMLTQVLGSLPLRPGLSAEQAVEDFRLYMDYVNLRFRTAYVRESADPDALMREHEAMCHRQLHMLLYGVVERKDEEHG